MNIREQSMGWKKLGRICTLGESSTRSSTHMQGPVAIIINNRIRIYFAARDSVGKSYPARLDVDITNPTKILDLSENAIMSLGPMGTFDDEGSMPACAIDCGQNILLYYSGWNRRITVPYHNTTGLACSKDQGLNFERMFDGPLLDRTPTEPWMAVTPWVRKEGEKWKMWYVSGLGWIESDGKLDPIYGVKYAESTDAIHWERDGKLTIPMRYAAEAIARPSVIHADGRYHMWYCYRDTKEFRDGAGSYRIGYSQSMDGLEWQRCDTLAGIDVSSSGWDSRMLCYPYVLQVERQYYLFYNGNSFGQTGIGCAVWQGEFPRL